MAEKEAQEKIDQETEEALERYRRDNEARARAAKFFGCPVHKVVRSSTGGWTVR